MRGNDDNIKEITKHIKKTARRIRTKQFDKGFKENTWDFVKYIKRDLRLNTQRYKISKGKVVNE